MTQAEFLTVLESSLKKKSIKNFHEIILDYQEHFSQGLSKGKSEEEIAKAVGNPKLIASAYETENLLQQVRGVEYKMTWKVILKLIGRLIVLAPFNFLVIILSGAFVFSLLAAGWIMAVLLTMFCMLLFVVAFTTNFINLSMWIAITIGSFSLGLLGLVVLTGVMMFFIARLSTFGLIKYLHWNAKFILNK